MTAVAAGCQRKLQGRERADGRSRLCGLRDAPHPAEADQDGADQPVRGGAAAFHPLIQSVLSAVSAWTRDVRLTSGVVAIFTDAVFCYELQALLYMSYLQAGGLLPAAGAATRIRSPGLRQVCVSVNLHG
jgi:hypothetical protein